MLNMKLLTLTLVLLASVEAALRFGCSTVSIQRIDPLVSPGAVPSGHLHQIVGGNAFNVTMKHEDGDIADRATCTTCTFSEDFSNYWTAVMFFKHSNGSYHRVPIMQNTALPEPINGGMTIYYTQQDFFSNGNQHITAFQPVSYPHRPREAQAYHFRDSACCLETTWLPPRKGMVSSLSAFKTRTPGSPRSTTSLPSHARAAS